jgi:hypothetical protein
MVPRADCGPHSANRSAAVDPVSYITRHIHHRPAGDFCEILGIYGHVRQ